MQPLLAYNALIWENTITILTFILFVVFLVRGLYLFAVLEKHLLKSNQGFQYQQQARDTRNSLSQQQEPSTEYVAGGHPGTTSWHPSPAGAALDQDRVAMPPPPPRPPQQRGAGPFDDAELRALYGINASTPLSQLVATLREPLRDVDPNRVFAVVPLPHAATTEIFVRQLQALVTPGAQVSDDLVEARIWWFNTHQLAQGGVWVPHLGWVHTLIAPPTEARPAPSTGGRELAAPPPRPDNLRIPPHEGLAALERQTARSRGHNLTSLAAPYPETTRAAPPPRERDPGTIAMNVLENGHYYQVRIIPHPQRGHWSLEAVDSMLPGTTDLLDSPTPLLPGQPRTPRRPSCRGRQAPGTQPCPLLPVAVVATPLATHQGMVSGVEVPPRRPTAAGGHPRTDGRDPHCDQLVPRLRDPPDPGASTGRATAARHPH